MSKGNIDYIDIIDKVFRKCRPELVNYVGITLKEKDENRWWEKYVLQKLYENTTKNLPKNGSYDDYINSLDILACLNIIILNWIEIFKSKLECKISHIYLPESV